MQINYETKAIAGLLFNIPYVMMKGPQVTKNNQASVKNILLQASQEDNPAKKATVQVLITFPGDDLNPKFDSSVYKGDLDQVKI